MNVKLEKLDKNVYKVNLEIPAELAATEYNKACRKFGENLSVQGFRKGKAPRHIIEKHVGEETIKHKVLDILLPGYLADVVSENQLDLITEPLIESYNFELGAPVAVTVKLEVKPDVTLPNYKGQTIEVPECKTDEGAVEKEIESLRNRFAKLEQVVGRPTEPEDIVYMDFSGTINGEPIKGGAGKNQQLDLSNSHFIPGFAEQLVDKNIGEEFKIKVTFPENYGEATLAGKEAEFTVTINEIRKKILPDLNDEFAQKLGPFQTVEDLKNNIKSYIEESCKNENRIRAEKILVEKVVDEAKLEIPDTMINREAKYLMEEVQMRAKQQGVSWEQMIEAQGHENIWNSLREEATKRVKTSLVLGAIAKAEDLNLTEGDFANKVKEIAGAYHTDEEKIYKQLAQNQQLTHGMSQQIMSQKIVNYLLENNEVKYIEE